MTQTQHDPIQDAIAAELQEATDSLAEYTRQEVEIRLLLTAAQDAAHAAWEPAGEVARLDDIPAEIRSEIDRTKHAAEALESRYDGVRAAVARTQNTIDRLASPSEYDRRVAKRESGRQVGERIKMASKKQKETAKDQGVPEVYLSESGNFKPGYDARLKSDLIKAVLDEKPTDVLHTFTSAEAQALLEKRNWLNFLAKSRSAREAREARAAKKAAKKAEAKAAKPKRQPKPKAAVAEAEPVDAAGDQEPQAKPDPKPVKQPKPGRRGTRVAA